MSEKRRRSTGKTTLADVARLAGVSAMTASRALRMPEKVSPDIRLKIAAAISELNYVPNLQAQSLASGRSQLIMMVTPSFTTPGFTAVSEALQQAVAIQGYTMMFSESGYAPHTGQPLLEPLLAYHPAALILFQVDCPRQTCLHLEQAGLPVMTLGAQAEPAALRLGVDFSQPVAELVAHLTGQGYRHLGLVCTQATEEMTRQILRGWHRAMLVANQSPHRVVTTPQASAIETGHTLFRDLLLQWPELDALICSSDEVACGCLMASHSSGMGVPDPLALASIGGGTLTSVCAPPLTCVEIPWPQIGREAGRRLLARLQEKPVVITAIPKPRLHTRASSYRK